MTDEDRKQLLNDKQGGLLAYEYLANHIFNLDATELEFILDSLYKADLNGQFSVSAARYLAAIDKTKYKIYIDRLVKNAIDRDRERRYIGDLLESLWGKDYHEKAHELALSDDNFRRIYKRIFN